MNLSRKGQYSTFMKPLIILIFGGLMISLLTTSINFNIGLTEEESQLRFQTAPNQEFSDLASCLSVNEKLTGSNYLLNQTMLERMAMKNQFREPGCAENFRYGYEVTVEQNYLRGISPGKMTKAADVVFALDDSGSMGGYLNQVKQNTREFIDSLPEGSRVGMFTYASPPNSYINNRVNLTQDVSKVTSELASIGTDGGQEPEDLAIKYTLNQFDFKDTRRKILIILATEPATRDTPTSKSPTEWAQEAANRNIQIYTVSSMAGEYVDIAQITEGKRFSVNADYSSIFEEIAGEERFIAGKSTCTVPPVRQYNGTAQVVFWADASDDYDEEWEAVCGKVKQKMKTLEARGLKANISFYAPGQPGTRTNGKGQPMTLSGQEYNYSSVLPSCIDSPVNNATTSSHGKGITEWSGEGLTDYNSSKDYGLEAWGVSSKWILENHDWNQSADRRMLFVLGDQDPTGGNSSGEDFRTKKNTEELDNETEIVRNVTELSNNKSVSIYTMTGEMEYKASDRYGDPDKNDAKELMRYVSSKTGGAHIEYQRTGKLPEKVKAQFRGLSEQSTSRAGTCTNVTYRFGETAGSRDENLDRSLQVSFPASVRQSEALTTPATVKIELRKGPLEKLAGAINKAVKTGKTRFENTSVYVSVNNDETLEVRDQTVERKNLTTYKLHNPSGDSVIDMHDDLIIGVNGRTVFQDRDQSPSTLDFYEDSLQFKAYKGASLQIIALNTVAPKLKLEKLELRCVNGCPDNGQMINSQKIQATEGTEEYRKLGGLGPFYHNFTQVKIGKTTELQEKAVCYGETDSCTVLRSQNVEDLTLRPGSHDLRITYSPSQGVTFR